MNPTLFTNVKKRTFLDAVFAVTLLAAMLVPVWMIGSFIVDSGSAPAPTTASPCELVHRT